MRRALVLRLTFALSLIPLALAPVTAIAQAPAPPTDAATTARQRYNAGSAAFQQRRFVEAALDFEAASAAMPSPVTLFTAALAWEQANVPDRAADDYGRCVASSALPADKLQQAKDRLAALEAVLGRVDVTAPDGWRVQLDANTEVATPATLHGAAGTHTVSARAPDGAIDHKPVSLELGKAEKLTLVAPPTTPTPPKVAPPPPEPPPAPPVAPPPAPSGWTSTRHTIGLVSLGFGGSALLSGIVLGLQAKSAKDAYDGAPTQAGYDHASALQTWTNVAFIGGALFTVGGALLEFWPASKPVSAAPVTEQPAGEPPAESKRATPLVAISPTLGGAVVWGAF
jgi:hypothetical protein